MTNVPPDLKKAMGRFLREADALSSHDKLMAYFCRLQAMNEGIGMVHSSDENKAFLLNLMSMLETAKQELEDAGHNLLDAKHAFNWANKVFLMADEDDRAGNASKKTARQFIAAATFIDVLGQFGKIPDAMVERRKYAKFKAADILRCIKQGVKPLPGPPGKSEEERELERMMAEDEAAGESGAPPSFPEQSASFTSTSTTSSSSGAAKTTDFTSDVVIPDFPEQALGDHASSGAARDLSPQPPAPAYYPDAYAPSAPSFAPSSVPSHPVVTAQTAPGSDEWRAAYERERDARLQAERRATDLQAQLARALAAASAAGGASAVDSGSASSSGSLPAVFRAHPNISADATTFAQKHARFVASALQYDDVGTALKELRTCLNALVNNTLE